MDNVDRDALNHPNIYVPWDDGSHTETGKELALYIARELHKDLTVVCPVKRDAGIDDRLARHSIVTERGGHVKDDGVVLAWGASYKAMDKVSNLTRSVLVVVEWPAFRFEGWAKLVGAYNALTGEVMESGLSEHDMKILGQILFAGYKNWDDDNAERQTLRFLGELAASDAYDREIVLAYARMHRDHATRGLETILDTFEANRNN